MTGRRRCSNFAVGCAVVQLAIAASMAARAAGTIDFEESVPDSLFQKTYSADDPYHEDGFVIAVAEPALGGLIAVNPARDVIGNAADGGSKHMTVLELPGQPYAGITFEREDQGYFSVHSLRLSEYSQVFPVPETVRLVGIQDGGIVVQLFTTDGAVDGTAGLPDFELVELDPDFSNLLRFEILGLFDDGGFPIAFSVDDVAYSVVVPEPGTASLLVLGLVGLSGCRRART